MKAFFIGLAVVCFFITLAMWACCSVSGEDEEWQG